jgi:hypothetical protein
LAEVCKLQKLPESNCNPETLNDLPPQ